MVCFSCSLIFQTFSSKCLLSPNSKPHPLSILGSLPAPCYLRGVNMFASPQPGQPPVVVEGARGTFTLESGVTRVSTSLFSNLNVEGMLVGKQIEAKTIKWKLGLPWGSGVKNPSYLDHFGHHRYAREFTEQEEMEYVLDNRPWYVRD